MMSGEFSQKGELIFEIDLIAGNETHFPVEAIFDIGFTGWLLLNNRDALSLGWECNSKAKMVQTANGKTALKSYRAMVLLDGEEFLFPAYGGYRVEDILLGVRWLQFKRLVADFSAGVLTLG
jgi:predicted aspartyl protease